MYAGKRAALRFYLGYTTLWVSGVIVVLLTRAFARWGDLGHMLLGLAMALPVWLAPLWLERERPLHLRYGCKAAAYITLISFLQNYFGTPLFFQHFGLEYHFNATWKLNGSPTFLSLMTVAYFSTYFAVIELGLQIVSSLLARLPSPWLKRAGWTVAAAAMSYAMALLETLFMQNRYLEGYFAYADKQRMMWTGSICYGTLLFFAIVMFVRIDEDKARPTPFLTAAFYALGANTLVMCAYEFYAYCLSH
jgi:hypothetical protein